MSTLNSWQKLTRVLPSQPFGNGVDGATTISSNTTQSTTTQSCSGSSGSSTLTIASGAFTNGDIVLIHQSRGTGVGQWEINRISSGGGTTSLTMQATLQYTYTDSGDSQAQVVKIPQYTTVTINTGQTWSGADWDGNVNGFLIFAASVSTTITGVASTYATGFLGGANGYGGSGATTQQGEGTGGARTQSTSPQGNGGGGADNEASYYAGGGAGGHANSGQNGWSFPVLSNGGGTAGSADLTTMVFGGGGACSQRSASPYYIQGGDGAGIVAIFTNSLTVTGNVRCDGQNGYDAVASDSSTGGGAGAGGSVLIVCQTATLGSNLIYATGGKGGAVAGSSPPSAIGADASTGRIAVHHSGTVTGTTNPTFTDVTDPTLVPGGGGAFLYNMIV